ncbi:MAG: bifunctional 4-hydroxy-2-oxoglutarate aldolase/2-dehydro-3-deoxy-phosphogluconate aldolase [Motilibacteraceae bacterium]
MSPTASTAARSPFVQKLGETRLVAILRAADPAPVVAAARTLLQAGVRVLEVSLTTPGATEAIGEIASQAPAGSLIGAGTVLTEQQAAAVLGCGAQFAVTPALSPGVRVCLEAGLPVAAGAFTPTEVLTALQLGVDAVKVFPAGVVGPGYVAALRDPFPGARLVPVGGVGIEDVPAYLRSGALAVGVGGPLLGDAARGGSLDALAERARAYLRAASSEDPR